MKRFICLPAAVVALVLLISACGDNTAFSDQSDGRVASAAVTPLLTRARTHETFPCTVSRLNPQAPPRYLYGTATMTFNPAELAGNGATALYVVRSYGSAPDPVFVAKCIIPRTESAVRRMRHLFRVPAEGNAGDAVVVLADGDIPIDGIVTDPVCQWGGYYPNCRSKAGTGVQCPATDPNCSGGGGDPGWDDGGPGDDGGDDPDPPDPCETGYQMIDDPDVQRTFASLWDNSNYDRPMSERRERGAFILKNNTTGEITTHEWPLDWPTTPCGSSIPPLVNGVIAVVHTHPFKRGDQLTECEPQDLPPPFTGSGYINYTNQPSIADDSAMVVLRRTHPQLVGLVIDADSITAFTGDNTPESELKLGRCGY